MAHPFSAANSKPATASWPVFGVWSVEKGPATLDTSEICSPEATVVKSYDPAKSGILCARRGLHGFAWFFAGSSLYLDAAQRRLLTSAGGHSRELLERTAVST